MSYVKDGYDIVKDVFKGTLGGLRKHGATAAIHDALLESYKLNPNASLIKTAIRGAQATGINGEALERLKENLRKLQASRGHRIKVGGRKKKAIRRKKKVGTHYKKKAAGRKKASTHRHRVRK